MSGSISIREHKCTVGMIPLCRGYKVKNDPRVRAVKQSSRMPAWGYASFT